MKKIPYAARKDEIHAVLLQRAKAGLTISYSELGQLLGIPVRGPWKPILDGISREERGRPDLTYLVISRTTGLPGQIEFELAKPPTPAQRRKASEVQDAVFRHYRTIGIRESSGQACVEPNRRAIFRKAGVGAAKLTRRTSRSVFVAISKARTIASCIQRSSFPNALPPTAVSNTWFERPRAAFRRPQRIVAS